MDNRVPNSRSAFEHTSMNIDLRGASGVEPNRTEQSSQSSRNICCRKCAILEVVPLRPIVVGARPRRGMWLELLELLASGGGQGQIWETAAALHVSGARDDHCLTLYRQFPSDSQQFLVIP